MGCTLKPGRGGDIDLNLVINDVGKQMNRIIQTLTKSLENRIQKHANIMRQSMNEQTKHLKTIAENFKKSSAQVSQIKMGYIENENEKLIKITQSRMQFNKNSLSKIKKYQGIKKIKQYNWNDMISQMPQLYMQKIIEIYNRIQKIHSDSILIYQREIAATEQ